MKIEKQLEVINEIIAPEYKLVLTRLNDEYKNFSIAITSQFTPNPGETIQACSFVGKRTLPDKEIVRQLINKIITTVLGIGEDAILRHLKDLKKKGEHLKE